MKYVTCVLSDHDLATLRAIRGVIADSNHPDRGALIAVISRLDGSAGTGDTTPQAYRTSWIANPGHEIPVAADERIALRLVRMHRDGESLVTHHILDTPVPAGMRHEVLGYSVTALVRSGDEPAKQLAAWTSYERAVLTGGK